MPHISYSELKNWCHCPYYHKLVNIDKIKVFEGNEYTAFGTALHSVCEELVTDELNHPVNEAFVNKFREELKKLKTEELDKKLVVSMFQQGEKLSEKVLPALENYFDDSESSNIPTPTSPIQINKSIKIIIPISLYVVI